MALNTSMAASRLKSEFDKVRKEQNGKQVYNPVEHTILPPKQVV